jgi:hypothetical protein
MIYNPSSEQLLYDQVFKNTADAIKTGNLVLTQLGLPIIPQSSWYVTTTDNRVKSARYVYLSDFTPMIISAVSNHNNQINTQTVNNQDLINNHNHNKHCETCGSMTQVRPTVISFRPTLITAKTEHNIKRLMESFNAVNAINVSILNMKSNPIYNNHIAFFKNTIMDLVKENLILLEYNEYVAPEYTPYLFIQYLRFRLWDSIQKYLIKHDSIVRINKGRFNDVYIKWCEEYQFKPATEYHYDFDKIWAQICDQTDADSMTFIIEKS